MTIPIPEENVELTDKRHKKAEEHTIGSYISIPKQCKILKT